MLFFLVWRRERGSSAPLDRDLGKREPLILKIPALWAQATSSVGETPWTDPTREMAWSAKPVRTATSAKPDRT